MQFLQKDHTLGSTSGFYSIASTVLDK